MTNTPSGRSVFSTATSNDPGVSSTARGSGFPTRGQNQDIVGFFYEFIVSGVSNGLDEVGAVGKAPAANFRQNLREFTGTRQSKVRHHQRPTP